MNDPLSGNRAQGVINGNLRLARQFRLPRGSLDAAVDIFNVANSAYKIQENDVSGIRSICACPWRFSRRASSDSICGTLSDPAQRKSELLPPSLAFSGTDQSGSGRTVESLPSPDWHR